MQPTERIHPGGKPSHSHPPNDLSKRTVNFYRQVLNTREQSQTEDVVGTEENGVAEEKNEAVEVVKGTLYQWASNICHLDDTKVKVEDLSDRDIGAQLAPKVQDLLSKILKSDPDEMQVRAYSKSEHFEGPTSEEFVIAGPLGDLRVCRRTYHNIDARNGETQQYSKSTFAQQISADAAGKVPPAPTEDQLKYVACRILAKDAKDNGKLSRKNDRDMFPMLLGMAQEELYNHREDAAFLSRLGEELNGTIQRPADQKPELVDRVEEKLHPKKVNPYHDFLLDTEASKACDRIEGFDIVILRDGHFELICGVFTQAVQKLFAAGTMDKMSTAAEAFAWRFPYRAPDDQRHNANKSVHLAKYPDKDVHSKDCKQPHFAVCGVVHYGVHHEAGRAKGFDGLGFQTFNAKYKSTGKLLETNAWKEEFPKLKSGVYGVAAKVSRLALEAWDRRLYEDYLEIRQHLPDSLNLTLAASGENPYGYMAQLVDILTEGHTDITDWKQGLAALTCFGSFTGGDLVLKELGVRIAFPPGSNCHLRGQGLRHFISGYEGIRHCIVLTNKESVRQTTSQFDERLKNETERAAKLESRAPADWTEEEQKLHEAYTEGKNAMLEKIWKRIQDEQDEKRRGYKKSKRADKSETACPEEPDNKRAKTTGKAQ